MSLFDICPNSSSILLGKARVELQKSTFSFFLRFNHLQIIFRGDSVRNNPLVWAHVASPERVFPVCGSFGID